MALTTEQTKLVMATAPILQEHGEQITTAFYKNLLHDHPELNNYFNTANQQNGRQARALAGAVLSFAANIDNMSELTPKVERMCNKHSSLGVQPEHYPIVGEHLIRAFGEVLGSALTPELVEAWGKAYGLLANILIGREAQLYKDFEEWTSWRNFKVDKVVPENENIFSFYLVPEDGKKLPKFLPGQYISVQVQGPDGYKQARQYSLSDAWREDYYRISVRRDEGLPDPNAGSQSSSSHPGLVSNLLIDQLGAGSIVGVSHPAGDFFVNGDSPSNIPLVLISAGVGFTPLLAIANTVTAAQAERPISWIHVSRRTVPFEDHITELRKTNPKFRTIVFKTDPGDVNGSATHDHHGRLDLAKVDPADLHLQNSGAEYYICGPEQFMGETSEYLKAQGVGAERIKLEIFNTGDLEWKRA
ncbi:globin-like protein [Dichotomopilus funicola]|uniref:nitric oxide dioxygenase n=1 Tax=Dichotomopilus funicola TaxID=1934379 RepID=A0AAN6ZSW4_9PEZI|nr:globin-like protein [Dichotomopilus funicola]